MQEFAKVKLSEEEQDAVDRQVQDDVYSSRQSNLSVMPVYVKRETVDGKKHTEPRRKVTFLYKCADENVWHVNFV